MSLASMETALVEYIGDVIVNEGGRPVPRISRYHGTPSPGCCTADGLLTIHWTLEYLSGKFPSSGATDACASFPVPTLNVRYLTCWHLPDANENGLIINDATWERWDADAAILADLADLVVRAIKRLSCGDPSDDPFVTAVLDEIVAKQIRLIDVAPIPEEGDCAGVVWRIYSTVKSAS